MISCIILLRLWIGSSSGLAGVVGIQKKEPTKEKDAYLNEVYLCPDQADARKLPKGI
jgi:hypothetical protein